MLLLLAFLFAMLNYHVVPWCSHDTEQQICQFGSVSVEIGTRLKYQFLPPGFLDVLMALRCTTLPFLYLFIFT